ncbi:MAG: sigma-70 family RNA polymerase sigma factor [Spirochaetota bacterium]
MKQLIPDRRVKQLLRRFNGGDRECFGEILRLVSPYVYHYPRIVFGADEDRCGDFYEYVLVRLKKILSCYKEAETRFVTWFTVVLRNRYLNHLRETGGSAPAVDLLSLDGSRNLYSLLSESRDLVVHQSTGLGRLVERVVAGLNERQRLYFHLYYLETLRPEDLGFMAITLGRPPREVLHGLEQVRSSMTARYRAKERLSAKLGSLYLQFVRCQKENRDEHAERYRRRRDRVLEEYRRVKLNPSYESIARFLDVPLGTVSTGIARMKKAARAILEEHADETMSVS